MRNIVFILGAIGAMAAGAVITLNIGGDEPSLEEMAKCKETALSFQFE